MDSSEGSLADFAKELKSKPRYMKLLPNGDYDTEVYEDEKDWKGEEELQDVSLSQQGCGADKRETALIVSTGEDANNIAKKGRISSSDSIALV